MSRRRDLDDVVAAVYEARTAVRRLVFFNGNSKLSEEITRRVDELLDLLARHNNEGAP